MRACDPGKSCNNFGDKLARDLYTYINDSCKENVLNSE